MRRSRIETIVTTHDPMAHNYTFDPIYTPRDFTRPMFAEAPDRAPLTLLSYNEYIYSNGA